MTAGFADVLADSYRKRFGEPLVPAGPAGYRAPRVARDGHRFWIEDVTVWNLSHADGAPAGQAALIPRIT